MVWQDWPQTWDNSLIPWDLDWPYGNAAWTITLPVVELSIPFLPESQFDVEVPVTLSAPPVLSYLGSTLTPTTTITAEAPPVIHFVLSIKDAS